MAKTNVAVAEHKLPAATDVSIFDNLPSGLENLTSRDLIIPRITILQGLSPQVTRGKPEFDETAKVGDIYDRGLQERFPDGIEFIPVLYKVQWLEWAPRNSGKGLVAIHDTDAILKQAERDEDSGRFVLPNGNYIAETAQLFGLNVTADFRRSFIPMASTQLKKARQINTWATSEKIKRADGSTFSSLFYRAYKLTAVPEANAEGSWMGWKVERSRAVVEMENPQEIINEIVSFRDSLIKGGLRGDLAGVEHEHLGGRGEHDTF